MACPDRDGDLLELPQQKGRYTKNRDSNDNIGELHGLQKSYQQPSSQEYSTSYDLGKGKRKGPQESFSEANRIGHSNDMEQKPESNSSHENPTS